MAPAAMTVWPGRPYPLGATWDGSGRQLRAVLGECHQGRAVPVRPRGPARDRAHRAARIHRRGLARLSARGAPGHALRLPRARPLRARAPATASIRHKLLLDPYAKALRGQLRWSDAHFGYRLEQPAARTSRSTGATTPRGMPKCAVVDDAYTWGDDRRPACRWGETIIYEPHVRGITMRHPGVPRAAARHASPASAIRR